MGERGVRNAEVEGSNPFASTSSFLQLPIIRSMNMLCPKCGRETPASARFCVRCHATLRFACPVCKHAQTHGGACDSCGTDFAKYAVVLEMQLAAAAEAERKRRKSRATLVRQLVLLPVTGGLSLLKHFHDQMRDRG